MSHLHDLTGQRFNRLTVAWPVGRTKGRNILWLCFCDCGKFKIVSAGNLKAGNVESCRCLSKERTRKRSTRHGAACPRTPEYRSYQGAKERCTNRRCKDFHNYGGRGIKFLFNNFEEFFVELGARPCGKTVDRIDNDGHYEKGNVRWATPKEQINNRRISATS